MSAVKMIKHTLLLLCLMVPAVPGLAMGAIPSSVDGQPIPTLAPMIEKTRPAVVNIATKGKVNVQQNPMLNDPFFGQFFRQFKTPQKRQARSLGSGVIIDAEKGFIVTNHHVVDGAHEIEVTLESGAQVKAELVASDPKADVAVLKVKAEKLTAIPYADSDKVRVGDFIVAIGNPFGLGQTVTSGIISALGRSGLGIEDYEDFIQTDASINPGNSGGALVNLKGELVGINTAILTPGGNSGNVGIGFAIPINMVVKIVDQLLEYGEVRRGMLGVIMQDLTRELAQAFDVKNVDHGIVISQVIPDTAAEAAGLKVGDVITHLNGDKVKNSAAMRNFVGLVPIGDKIKMNVIRDGKKRTITATIREVKEEQVAAGDINTRLSGASIEELTNKKNEKYLVVTGVEQGSPAWNASLRKGDIIVSVNRKRVRSIDEFKKIVGDKDRQLLLNIQRGRSALFVLLK